MFSIIALVIISIWMLPLIIKAKINFKAIIRMVIGLIVGAVPVVIVAVIGNIFFEARVLPLINTSIEIKSLIQAAFTGFYEEGAKLLGALLCVIGFKSQRKIDYILVFGAVGAGFEIAETFAAVDSSLITLFARVALALHVLWLYHNGAKYFEQKQGKSLALLGGYIKVAILHGLFDAGLLMISIENISDDFTLIGFILLLIGLIVNIIFIIKTMKMAKKSISE